MPASTHTSDDPGRDRARRVEEHALRVSKEGPHQPIDELRDSLGGFLRQLDVNEVDELQGAEGNERRLLDALLRLYDSNRDRLLLTPPPSRRRRLTRPIDAVEVEVLLDRYGIEDADLEDESLITTGAVFPRRTLQACVRRKQAVRADTLSSLCAAMTAVLHARGNDAAVAEADILPVPISVARLRQVITNSSYGDEEALLYAVNERIEGQLELVARRGTIEVPSRALRADLLKQGETINLMHFQLRALIAALDVSEESLLSRPSVPQPEAAVQWVHVHGLNELIDRIYAARQWRDGGFRIDPYAGPGMNNPTQPYVTAQCVAGLLQAGHVGSRPKELQGALKFLAESRCDFQIGQDVVRGWRYFANDANELDYPITDIAGWIVIAEAAALRRRLWKGEQQRKQALGRLTENTEGLLKQQAASGGFVPIPQVEDQYARTYTTCMAAWALAESVWARSDGGSSRNECAAAMNRAVGWLLDHHRSGVGFIPDPNVPRSEFFPGLHAQCVFTLSLIERLRTSALLPDCVDTIADSDQYLAAGRLLVDWFTSVRRRVEDHNIAIDRHSHFHPTPYRLENTRHLWAPWTMAAFHHMAALDVEGAQSLRDQVIACFHDFWLRSGELGFGCNGTYEIAESLFCFSHLLGEEM